MLVKDHMTPNPMCGHPDMSVIEAQALMEDHNFRHLPIVDDDGKLAGLLTQQLLLRAVPSDVSKFSPFVIKYIGTKLQASSIMVKDVITIDQDTAIEEAARIMADEKIGCLPVVQDGELVGIISDNDLFSIMVGLLGARRAGVRVTIRHPDRAGEVARISKAIADQGGYLSVFVTFPTAEPDVWSAVVKVTDVPHSMLVKTLNSLPDVSVLDTRQV
ncbi:MAG: CBS and ACT domain-containing protein [Anaerolineae bacterium]